MHKQISFDKMNVYHIADIGIVGTVQPRLLRPLKYKCLSNRGSGGRCL